MTLLFCYALFNIFFSGYLLGRNPNVVSVIISGLLATIGAGMLAIFLGVI